MTAENDTSNVFSCTDYNEGYWTRYLAARPEYSQPFYQSIYDYHATHGGSFEIAHDIGTGPGQVAAELSQHFGTIVASDNIDSHLAIVQQRLGSLVRREQPKVQLVHSPAESIAEKSPPESADLVAVAECMPLFDADTALKNFHTILKPGGTLAIWFYGRPAFAEPQYAPTCQSILASIVDMTFAKVIKGGGPQHRANWKRATDCITSFLDDVDLSSNNQWSEIQRRKWNSEHEMAFYGPDACDFQVESISKIDEKKETVVEKKDPEL